MNRTERFYLIDQLLHERGLMSFDALLGALGVSRATLKRDLECHAQPPARAHPVEP